MCQCEWGWEEGYDSVCVSVSGDGKRDMTLCVSVSGDGKRDMVLCVSV